MHIHKWIQVCWPGRGRRWNVTKEQALIVRLNRDQKQRRCWEREEWWKGCMKCHIMLPKQHDIHNGIKDIIQTQSITLELTSLLESSIINHILRSFWRHHMVYDRASESRWLPSWCVFFPGCQILATLSCVYGVSSSGKLPYICVNIMAELL